MTVKARKYRFTVEDYHKLAQAGVLSEDSRVELIEGEIIEMVPIGSRHAASVKRLNHLFSQQVEEKALVSVQDPVHLGEHFEPQPDLALLEPHSDFYADRHPGPGDLLLVVEVAENSQEYDREVKIPLYAQAGIPEAWLVDLDNRVIVSYRQPGEEGYQKVREHKAGERLVPGSLEELEVKVEKVLPEQ